jgi:L-ascorbate metabolism protein UlaG (beta-lactamase superfamily)
MPDIDYLLVSHEHWDHLDYPSIDALRDKVRHVVCGLGLDQYFVQWGYAKDNVHAADWFTALTLNSGLTIHIVPARHYTLRLFSKNQILWAGFVLETLSRRLFFSGVSGYGQHIAKIAEKFQGFDLVALDMGQYDERWHYIHMTPEEAATAAEELHARVLLPAHVGKFTIANHA